MKTPCEIFAYCFGIIGSLILGVGMCLAMGQIGASLSFAMPLGVVVGVAGILAVSTNYPIYKRLLNKRKNKYSSQILALSDELLNK